MSKKGKNKGYRFAPSYLGNIAANSWRIWTKKNETYISTRNPGNVNFKISIHASGEIHFKVDQGKDTFPFKPAINIAAGAWLLALELKFLLCKDAFHPNFTKEKNEIAIISVPENYYLVVNVLVGAFSTSASTGIPQEVSGAQILWSSILDNGNPVWLIGRLFLLDDFNKNAINEIRYEIQPKLGLSKDAFIKMQNEKSPYMEVFTTHTQQGNVIVIVPRGEEAFTIDENIEFQETEKRKCTINVLSPNATALLFAPDKKTVVGTLSFMDYSSNISLEFETKIVEVIAFVNLTIYPDNLIPGSSFFNLTLYCTCVPTIDGIQPRNWNYAILSSFDGTNFKVTLRQNSIGLKNINNSQLMKSISDSEEILFAAPSNNLTIQVSLTNPTITTEMLGRFTLKKK